MKSTYRKLKRQPRVLAETVTFLIALCILSVLVLLILYSWMTQSDLPPIPQIVERGAIEERQGQFFVPFTVTNVGGETAESVQVVAELKIDGEVEEAGEQQMDFLARGEKEEGAFMFTRNPRQGELQIRIASYKSP